MKPKPFWLLNHFTVPELMRMSFRWRCTREGWQTKPSPAGSLILSILEKGLKCTPSIAGEAAQSFGQLSIGEIWTCDVHSSSSVPDFLPSRTPSQPSPKTAKEQESLRLDAVLGDEIAPAHAFALEIGAPVLRRAADRRDALGLELRDQLAAGERLRHRVMHRHYHGRGRLRRGEESEP